MSHLRMIPLADLANAALPDEANARIVARDDGCGILAKVSVKKGEELCIDYNHRDGLTMLASYGCSLGLEKEVTLTKLKWMVPPHLHKVFDLSYLEKGFHLESKHEGLSEEQLMHLRMSSFWSTQDFIKALQAGYFKPQGSTTQPDTCSTEDWLKWRGLEAVKLQEVASQCEALLQGWESKVSPHVEKLKADGPDLSLPQAPVLIGQYQTDLSLLTVTAVKLRELAAGLTGVPDVSKEAIVTSENSLMDELS